MNELTEIKANLGFVIRGELETLQDLSRFIQSYLDTHPQVRIVHSQASASKLWINEGDEPNDRAQDQ